MPKIDLPAGSLGPKPTKKQMELLKKMATPDATVHVWSGIGLNSGGAYIDFHVKDKVVHDTISRGDVGKFYDWGWLNHDHGDFRSQDYSVTDRARKVIEKGETR
jgi:hypothetical protein